MTDICRLIVTVPDRLGGQRLDQALSRLASDYSRSRLQHWIRSGQVRVDGAIWRPKDRVMGGESVEILASAAPLPALLAQEIELDILYADDALLVINKPAGLVVHPAAGNPDGTLQNALLHYDPGLAKVPRCGIVHRLDKATSGLLVVARTLPAHHQLVAQLQAHHIRREYDAVVNGVMTAGGSIEAPIGRHPVDRKRMSVVPGGKPALTHYRVKERFARHTRILVRLETGRTHQIRVHMAHIRHPLLGDPVYGGRLRLPAGAGTELRSVVRDFRRQALHAARLSLAHPSTGMTMTWRAPLPADMTRLITALRAGVAGDAEQATGCAT